MILILVFIIEIRTITATIKFDTYHMYEFSITNYLYKMSQWCGVFSFIDLPCLLSDIHHFVKHDSSEALHPLLVHIF